MRRRDFVTLLGSVVVAKPLDAVAQNYPSRVVTIVVPYPAGGPTDTIARILADGMQGSLGQSVIIDNVGGAGGSIGVGRVAHALPDGYTLSIGHTQTHVFNSAVLKLNYDVVNDFTPISLIADTPIWIVSRKSLPADDLKGFIAWLKASNGKATMGMAGIGSPSEFAARIFAKETGTIFQFGRRSAAARYDWRPCRFRVRAGSRLLDYRPERPAQSLRGIAIQPLVGGPRGADTR